MRDIFNPIVSYGVGLDTQSRLPVCSCSGVPGWLPDRVRDRACPELDSGLCPHLYHLAVVFGKLLSLN